MIRVFNNTTEDTYLKLEQQDGRVAVVAVDKDGEKMAVILYIYNKGVAPVRHAGGVGIATTDDTHNTVVILPSEIV